MGTTTVSTLNESRAGNTDKITTELGTSTRSASSSAFEGSTETTEDFYPTDDYYLELDLLNDTDLFNDTMASDDYSFFDSFLAFFDFGFGVDSRPAICDEIGFYNETSNGILIFVLVNGTMMSNASLYLDLCQTSSASTLHPERYHLLLIVLLSFSSILLLN